jgi:NarL family two-component system response regulator LiaR
LRERVSVADVKKIRVVLVDDHRRVHEAVSTVLAAVEDIELVAHGNNGIEAVALADEHKPDVILMDVVMPGMDGPQATRIICERHPDTKILVLSSFQDDESVRSMLDNGAAGYVLKDALARDLADTIRVTYQGKTVFSHAVAQLLRNPPKNTAEPLYILTARELEVLKLVAEGLNNGEIAEKLTISASTVKFHMTNLLRKMKVDSRAEALVMATKLGLL